MGVISQLKQSMAAAFTPESERLRQTKQNESKESAFNLGKAATNINKLEKSDKPEDSLRDSPTPGYEKMWDKKPATAPNPEKSETNFKNAQGIPVPGSAGKKAIRLQTGWEQILFAQKKICEKAHNLMTFIDSPIKYATARKGKLQKIQGCIVDLDIEEHRKIAELQAKAEKEKKDAA